ncbi:unnamed protein product [Paramecium sonneborni]|uniref:Uncharacterized protein n=1 Tax=Paramecium sonneborni TaxID=65129 RepID=A0A8S1RKX7_9CILI|nr:unnamed protein product [Paramecium sonneborni]
MNQLVQVILFLNCTKVVREEDSPLFNKIVQMSELRSDLDKYLSQCENVEIKERLNYELQRLGLI